MATIKNKKGVITVEDLLNNTEESEARLESYWGLSHGKKITINEWHGMDSVPPASILDDLVKIFHKASAIPLELPMFILIHMISGQLTKLDIRVDIGGDLDEDEGVAMDLWTVLLAKSGSGKSTIATAIKKWVNYGDFIAPIQSDRSFINSLIEADGKGLLLQDEVSELLAKLESKSNRSDLKQYILSASTNQTITRKLADKTLEQEHPTISFLGMNTMEAWLDELTEKSMVDGTARRWRYVIVKEDEERKLRDKYRPRWQFEKGSGAKIKKKWDDMFDQVVRGTTYTISSDAEELLKELYIESVDSYGGFLPDAFFNTVRMTVYKYALIYHLMKADGKTEIGAESIGWAQRLVDSHMSDGATLIKDFKMPNIEKLLQRAEEIKADVESRGQVFCTRDLTKRMSAIKNIGMAEGLMKLVNRTYKQPELFDEGEPL